MAELNKPKRWSYSSWSTYEQCPAKWKFSYIDNLPWGSSAAMDRGTRMHKMAEDFVTGAIDFVPNDIRKVGPSLLMYKNMGAKAEETWLLDKNWEPVTNQDDAWIKAIVDLHYFQSPVIYVKDHKSGQMYDSHREQLELYGLIGLKKYPEAKRAETAAIYMDTGHEGMDGTIIRAMMPKLIDKWHSGAIRMYEDNTYDPKPGNCKWCTYAKDKGGPCQYSSRDTSR